MTLEEIMATVKDLTHTRITQEGTEYRVEFTSFTRDTRTNISITTTREGFDDTIPLAALAASEDSGVTLIYNASKDSFRKTFSKDRKKAKP